MVGSGERRGFVWGRVVLLGIAAVGMLSLAGCGITPGPVTGLGAVPTATSATLTWTKPVPWPALASGAVVRRVSGSVPPSGPTQGTLVADVWPEATVTDRGLAPLTTYSYAVFAYLDDDTFAPAATLTITTAGATAIAAGTDHSCALLLGGTVQCWGLNQYGQLGNGRTSGTSSRRVKVTGITTATAIEAGFDHSCALLSGGTVECWGFNANGRLGNGTYTNSSTPVPVTGITTAIAITAGYGHSCALLSGGTVTCWGRNGYGELGNGTLTDSSVPVAVTGITGATAITAGQVHSCALLSGGSVTCWGWNGAGQLGNGTYTDSSPPVPVTGITTATAITAGDQHSCAVLSGGSVKCWGANGYGELGNGALTWSSTPVTVTGIITATAITAGWAHSCALLSGGTVECWGRGDYGNLGNGTTTTISSIPVTVTGITNAIAVTAGSSHSCAVLSGGSVRCWGLNDHGQLGNGALTSSSTPVAVIGL